MKGSDRMIQGNSRESRDGNKGKMVHNVQVDDDATSWKYEDGFPASRSILRFMRKQ